MELCLCDITFQAMIILLISIYISISHTDIDEISAMKYINHHSLGILIMNVRVYMCVNIGFNECFDDTERIRAVYSLILKF